MRFLFGLVLVMSIVALLAPGREVGDGPVEKRLFDAGHYFLFLFLSWWGTFFRFGSGAISVTIGLTFFAAAVELLQPVVGREASMFDFIAGVLGAGLGGMASTVFQRGGSRSRVLAFIAVCSTGVVMLCPAYRAFQATQWRKSAFPVLARFDDPIELLLWRAERSVTPVPFFIEQGGHSGGVLAVDLSAHPWGTVCYVPGAMDWSRHEVLRLSLRGTPAGAELHIRIDDDGDVTEFGARFDASFPVSETLKELEIPIREIRRTRSGRELNLRGIRRVCFFSDDGGGKAKRLERFWLDSMVLYPARS